MITKELIEDAKAAGLLHIPESCKGKPLEQPTLGTMEKLAKLVELQRQRERQAVPTIPQVLDYQFDADSRTEQANAYEAVYMLVTQLYGKELPNEKRGVDGVLLAIKEMSERQAVAAPSNGANKLMEVADWINQFPVPTSGATKNLGFVLNAASELESLKKLKTIFFCCEEMGTTSDDEGEAPYFYCRMQSSVKYTATSIDELVNDIWQSEFTPEVDDVTQTSNEQLHISNCDGWTERQAVAAQRKFYEEIGQKYYYLKKYSPPSNHPDFVDMGYADGWQELEAIIAAAPSPELISPHPIVEEPAN